MVDKELAIRAEQSRGLTPLEVVENATTQAKLLMSIVEQTKCYQQIANKKYLQVEAWETIGAFNNTHAETESIAPIIKDNETIGYQARVQLWKNGQVVGGAVMPCYFTENCCKGKEGDAKHKACASAAQTFATSKAYRMNFSYVAILAGYQPLPAEEITEDMQSEVPAVNTKEHYCEEHKVNFFKRGKMRAFAHPIGDTGKWCNEEKPKAANTPDQEEPPEELFPEETPATSAGKPPTSKAPITPGKIDGWGEVGQYVAKAGVSQDAVKAEASKILMGAKIPYLLHIGNAWDKMSEEWKASPESCGTPFAFAVAIVDKLKAAGK